MGFGLFQRFWSNLKFVGMSKVGSGDAEPAWRDLLDGRTPIELRILIQIPAIG